MLWKSIFRSLEKKFLSAEAGREAGSDAVAMQRFPWSPPSDFSTFNIGYHEAMKSSDVVPEILIL